MLYICDNFSFSYVGKLPHIYYFLIYTCGPHWLCSMLRWCQRSNPRAFSFCCSQKWKNSKEDTIVKLQTFWFVNSAHLLGHSLHRGNMAEGRDAEWIQSSSLIRIFLQLSELNVMERKSCSEIRTIMFQKMNTGLQPFL